jgi:hypothetical protein|tara:strand:+ start:368 stop:577 length:210 start_codon:yes stop_codon:yes gene_type:complete
MFKRNRMLWIEVEPTSEDDVIDLSKMSELVESALRDEGVTKSKLTKVVIEVSYDKETGNGHDRPKRTRR